MELRILGALEVEEDGRVVRIAGAKQRTLLALLLLHANEPVPRDRLIGELWGVKQPQTVARARTAAPGEAAALLREALALWRGVPFAEIGAPIARAAHVRLEEQRLRPAGAGAPSPPGSRSWPGAARACKSWLRRGSP
jgi:Bacterial transcriptional activator domain